MENKLAIITVVYKNYDILEDYFDSLRKQENKNFKLFIADTSPQPKHINISDLPITVIPTENLGYAHGVNEGLRAAIKEDFTQFCVMNDDTYFNKNFVDAVLKSLRDYPNCIIGGKIYYAPGYEYHKSRYNSAEIGKVLWYAGGTIDWNNVDASHRGVDDVDHGQYNQSIETTFVTGCLMCFDKRVIDSVGFWDKEYFLYYEDTDYCVRAAQKGIKIYYDPSIVLWHKNAQSTEGSGSELHQKYQQRNQFIFGMKYAPLRTKIHLVKNKILKNLKLY